MANILYYTETVTDAGATYTFDVESTSQQLVIVPDTNPQTMLANIVVNFSGTPSDGQSIQIHWNKGLVMNGNTFTINGIVLTDIQA